MIARNVAPVELPAQTISTRAAAKAIFRLYEMFDEGPLESWIDELQEEWPDLAAMLFTVAKDE